MFSAYCKHCGTVVLLDPANVRSIHNTSDGVVVYFRCHAGHSGVWLSARRSPAQTRRARDQRTAAQGAATHKAVPSRLSGTRRSWWPRAAAGQRPRMDCPGVAPRRGWLRAG
jgi:hypothetical protein